MADLNGNGERRKPNWPVIIALVGWGGFGLIAWGSISQQVGAHDKRLDKIENAFVSDKDMAQFVNALNTRLGRIEGQLDRLENVFRRPQP